jgi:hypothetical protein
METTCAYCGWRKVESQEGHRKRQYCSERCKQAAYRQRKSKSKEKFSPRREAEQQAMAELRQRWPDFSWTTWCFLQTACRPLGEGFMERVAKIINDERTQAILKATQIFQPPLQDEGQS